MNEQFESIYHTAEDNNWWFKARRDFIYRFLRKRNADPSSRVLDIGCGGGGLLSYLKDKGYAQSYGIDSSPAAIAFCASRKLENIHLDDAQEIRTFSPNTFDVIVASDILEHLERPKDALRRWKELLTPQGIIILFVPAFSFLWSERDILNKHLRRYTRPEVAGLTAEAGLQPILMSYWNFIMCAPYGAVISVKKFSRNKVVSLKTDDSLLNKLLTSIMRLENSLILSGMRLPFGVSFLAVVGKRP